MKIGKLNWKPFAKLARRAMYLLAFAVLGARAATVATVGDAEYGTLGEAVGAAPSGSTVAVRDDIRLDTTLTVEGKVLTLDLNGKTLTVATEGDGIVVQDATLNLGNSGGTGKYVFECTASGSDGIFLHNTREDGVSTLNIDSDVEISFKPGVNSAIHAYGEAGTAVVNMNAGGICAKGEGQRVSAVIVDQNAAFNMKGGTFDLSVDFDTFSQNNDVVGVLVWGQNGVQKNGTVKIEGGLFNVGGKNAFAQAIQVGMKNGKSENISVEISGGEIVLSPSGDGEGYVFTPYNAAYASATMSGGRIRGTVTALTATASGTDTANMTVSGGTFSFEVKESYCADGFTVKATTDADGNTVYGVVGATATIADEKALRKAFYEAPTDGTTVTITLGADITLETLYAAENFGTETLADNAEGDTFNRYKIGVHPTEDNPTQWNPLVTSQTEEERVVYGAYYNTGKSDERIARLVVKAGQKIVLDLNGHTIQKNARATHGDWSEVCTDIIGNYGTLEVVDSSTGTKGTVKGIGYYSCKGAVLHNYKDATMTVKGVNVDGNATGMAKGTGQYVIANDGGTLTIDGANVFDTAATVDASLVVNTAGTVTIIGNATLKHPTTKAVNVKGGVVTVESATIISDKYAIYAKGGEVNVNDLKVTGTGTLAMEGNTATVTKKSGVDLPAPTGFTWVENDGKLVLKSFAAKIGETEYETLDAAITAVQDDGTIVVNAGDYKLNGSLSYAGKAFTIQSAEGAKVSFDMSAAVALHDAKITFTGVTFDYKTNKDYIGLQHAGTLVYNDCAIDGKVFLYAASETFNRCTFTQTAEDYNVWTYGAKEVAFNGCTFNCVGKAVLVYNEGANTKTGLAVSDCAFKASAPVEGKAAIEIDTSLMAGGATITVDAKTTAEGFAEGSNSKSTLWNDKKQTQDTNKNTTVTVAGETVFVPNVAQVGEKMYTTLTGALADVAEGKPLTWVSETAWPVATPVYYNGKFYKPETVNYAKKGALEVAIDAANAANAADVAKIYVRPGFDANELVLQAHQPMKTSLAIYGNDAKLSRNWEPCVEYPGENYHTLTKDVSIEIYNLHDGAGIWGQRLTAFTVTVTMADCRNAHEVLLNGQYESAAKSVNNFTIRRCTFDGSKAAAVCPVTTTSAGKVVVEDCTFANLNTDYVVNMNNKNGGKTEVSVKGCSFTNCGAAGKEVVRLTGEAEGSEVVAELDGLTFDETSKANAVIVGNKKTANNNASVRYTISKTTGTLNVYKQGATTAETTELLVSAEQPYTGGNAADPRTLGYATSGTAEALPAAPDMSGEVVNVTAAQAQYVLDGAYGSIYGKTINFTESIDATLVLGRASKYDGSQTVYRHGSHDGESMPYADYIAYKNQSSWTEGGYYERTVRNVTFTANEGVTVKGFTAEGGAHIYGSEPAPCYDYVRDTGVWCKDNSGFYKRAILKKITFKGLDFTAKVDFSTSEATTVYDSFTFTGCTFEIDDTTSTSGQAIHYSNENANGNVKNLVVEGCKFKDCFQGVYARNVKNVTVKDSTFDTTGHNAIAVQDDAAFDHGEVVITDNMFKNIGDRIIRFGHVGAGTTVTITGNTADGDSGKLDKETGKREIVAATALPENAADSIKASNNSWGENTVVAGVFIDDYKEVASVTNAKGVSVNFATLAEAVAAAQAGDTVTLLGDTVVANVVLGKSLTLDLNGKTVSSTSGAKVLTVTAGTVTVKNGTVQAGTVVNGGSRDSNSAIYVTVGQSATEKEITLTFENLTVLGIENQKQGVTAETMAALIDGGMYKYQVTAGTAVEISSQYDTAITVNVKNSTIRGGKGAATEGTVTEYLSGGANQADGGVGIYARGENLTLNIMEGSKVFGGDSDNKNAGKALELQKCASVVISNSTVQGGNSHGRGSYGIGGAAVLVAKNCGAITVKIEKSTLQGGDGGASWDGSGVELNNKAATVSITDSTVKSGRGENATGNAAAITLPNWDNADLTLSDVSLSGSDKNTVIKNGLYSDITLAGDVTVDAGTLKNVAISELGESVTIKIAEGASAEADTVVSLDPDRALVKDSDVLFRSDAAVAQVVDNLGNKMSYASLASAIAAAADGETVTVLADVTVAEQLVVEKPLTLDLGGKTVTSTYAIPANGASGADRYALLTKAAVTVKNGTFAAGQARALGAYANLTLTDATVTSELTGGHCCVAFCAAGGTYTVANATITGDYAIANFANNATIAITDSELEGSGCGLYHNGSNYGLKLTVTDTTVNGAIDQAIGEDKDPSGVYLSGSLDALANAENQNGANGRHQAMFTRCTIKGNTGVEVKYTDLTLEDCTVVATTEVPSYTPNNNGMTALGFAVVSTDNAKGETTPKPEGTITITGANGSYTGLVGLGSLDSVKTGFPDFADAAYAVSGGTFSTAIDAAYCASGYIPTKNADGTYGVKEGAYVAQVGTTKYDTLEGAIEAAVAAGQAVELLDDVVVTDFTLNVGVTIRSADETRHEIKGLKAITGTGVTLENVYLNLDQTLDIGGTDTTLKNCVVRAKDVGYWDIADGVTTGFTGGKKWTDNARSYLVRVTGTNVALTDCLIDGTDKDEDSFPNMCLAPVSGTDVTMTRCTFNEGWAACYYSTPHGTWTLDGCKFTKVYSYNIQAADTAANIVVKNCELAGWTSFGSDMASVSFEKCSFAKSSGFATIVAYKDVTFTDCSFTEDYKDNLYIEADTVADLTGCTVVDADGNASATVSLADLVECDADTGFAAIDATKNEDGKYTAGRFVGKEDAIRTAIADGYALTVGDDGSYTLDTAVAQIGTKGYASLAEAIAAAKSGDTITLLADVVNTDYAVANAIDIKLASGVTLDGNGKTISGNVKVTVSSEGGVTIKNANFRDIHNAADVSDAYKTKYGFSDDKVGTLSAIYAPNLAGALTISGCTFENSDWEAMQITPAEGAKIDIRNNVFKTSESDVVKEQLRHVHIEMAYGTDFDYEGTDIELTITDNQFLGETKEANMGVWWVGKSSVLDVTGNYYANPDAVSITLSDKSFKRENRCDLIYPARSVADVDVDDLTAVALVVKDAFNATAHQTFEAAVAAADAGATVKMLANVVLTEKQTIAKALVLDLNGKAITSTVNQFITIAKGGDLTVNDATGEGRIENTATGANGGVIGLTGGVLTVKGGTIASNSATSENSPTILAQLSSCAVINVVGGTVEANRTGKGQAIQLGQGADATLNVSGGTVRGSATGVYCFNGKGLAGVGNAVNVSGGTILGSTGNAVYSGANNKITISGGTLTPGGTVAALAIGGGSTATSSCTVTVGREGGTVDDVTIPSIDFKPSFSANEATVNLLSGRVLKFLGWDNMKVESVSQGKDKLLVGTDISKSLPGSDLLCQLDAESGLYEIVKLTVENAVAIVTHDGTETPYRTVEQAVRAVADGDTLTLKVDHTGSQSLSFSAKNVTVDLGGKTLTYTGATGGLSSALSFNQSTASDNTVTVKNGTIVAKAQDATCVRAEMKGDLSKTLIVVFGENLTLTSGNTSRYGGVVLGTGARTKSPCEKMTKGGLLVTEGETQWIYGETETAFTHANGTEVTLLNDWYCTDYEGAVKVPETCAFGSAKLNLDGHTIKHFPYGTGAAIVMGNDAKPYEGTAAKTLEISNGTITTSRHGAAVCGSNKSLTLDGVTLTTTGDKMFGLYANGMMTGNTVTLKSGSAVVSEKATGIYFPGAGTLTVEDSNVTGGMSGIEVRAGVLNVSGTSVIESTAAAFDFTNDDNGITTTGAAVAAVKHTVGNDLAVKITGGTFKGPYGFYANDPNAATGGTLSGEISGGTFSAKDIPADDLAQYLVGYLADGCKTVQQTIDGTLYYVVGPAITQIEVSLGDVKKLLPFSDAWLAEKIDADASGWTTAALEAEAANGLKKWQCYLFGLDPDAADAKIVATAKQGTVKSIPLAVANADAATSPLVTDGLVTVTYVLMGSNDNKTWTAQVAEAATPNGLAIPLTDKTYKFYRVDVKVTSAESAEGN